MLHAAASHLGLHSLLRPICLHIVNTVFYDYSQANDVHVCFIYSYAFIIFVLASVNAKIDSVPFRKILAALFLVGKESRVEAMVCGFPVFSTLSTGFYLHETWGHISWKIT